MGAKFEIFMGKDWKYYFHLRAPNNKIVAMSEAYESKQACEDGIKAVQKYAATATIEDLTPKPPLR